MLRFVSRLFLTVAIAHALPGSVFLFLTRRGFDDSNCIGRGKGFFQPDFQRLLKTIAPDVLVLVTLGSPSDPSCSCFRHFNARSARLPRPRLPEPTVNANSDGDYIFTIKFVF
jgi:hypothetical protein